MEGDERTPDASSVPSDERLGTFIGHLAVKQFITPEQLHKALAEQARMHAAGDPRPLGEILVQKGFLTREQLSVLLAQQRGHTAAMDSARQEDRSLGRLLVDAGEADPRHISECLRAQAESMERGEIDVPRLGELLVARGFASAEAVQKALSRQRKTTLRCPSCGRVYNVRDHDPRKKYRCRSCPAELSRPEEQRTQKSRPEDPPADRNVEERGVPARKGDRTALGEGSAFGRYRIVREIGRGAMGVVYEAIDPELSRRVALKLIQRDGESDSEDDDRFLREGQMLAHIPNHPAIVAVYEAGVIEGRRFIAMNLIRGRSLAERGAEAPLRRKIEILREVALAVHHAHTNGVIHRDLKPANILLDENGRPWITDFGLAKRLGRDVSQSLTASGVILGTPLYMSPEQAQGLRAVDQRSDVWALGVILFGILTGGRTPFAGKTAIEILVNIVRKPVPRPSGLVPMGGIQVDETLERICMKALVKRPADRYSSASRFADDLRKWLNQEPVQVSLPRLWEFRRVLLGEGGFRAAIFVGLLLAGYLFLPMPSFRSPRADAVSDRTRAAMIPTSGLKRDPAQRKAEETLREEQAKLVADQLRFEDERKKFEAQRNSTAPPPEVRVKPIRRPEEQTGLPAGSVPDQAGPPVSNDNKVYDEKARPRTESRIQGRKSVDLLQFADFQQNIITGVWTQREGALLSDLNQDAGIELPYTPPEAYDLEIVLTRIAGTGSFDIVLIRDHRQFALTWGSENNSVIGFEFVGGKRSTDNPTTVRKADVLEPGKSRSIVIQVRKDSVKARLDGKPVVQWIPDQGSLTLGPLHALRHTTTLGLWSFRNIVKIDRLVVTEMDGFGTILGR